MTCRWCWHSRRVQVSIGFILFLTMISSCLFAALQPFSANVRLSVEEFDIIKREATIRIVDHSIFGRQIYARPDLSPIVVISDVAGRREEQYSTTAAWRNLPDEGMLFKTPVQESLGFPITVSVLVKSNFSDATAWVSTRIGTLRLEEAEVGS